MLPLPAVNVRKNPRRQRKVSLIIKLLLKVPAFSFVSALSTFIFINLISVSDFTVQCSFVSNYIKNDIIWVSGVTTDPQTQKSDSSFGILI